jgi:hypothetical protein
VPAETQRKGKESKPAAATFNDKEVLENGKTGNVGAGS